MKIVLKAEQVSMLDLLKATNTPDEIMRRYYNGELPEIIHSIDGLTLMNALTNGYYSAEDKWRERFDSYSYGFSVSNSVVRTFLAELALDFDLDIIPKKEETK